MFSRLGRFTVRRRRAILVLTVAYVLAAGLVGSRVFDSLSPGGFEDPASESWRAKEFLEDELGGGDPELVLLVDAIGGTVDDPAVASAGADLTAALATEDHVAKAVSYWSAGRPDTLRGPSGASALVLVDLEGDDDEIHHAVAAIDEDYGGQRGPITVGVGGPEAVIVALNEQIEADLARAEAVAVPATLVLLILVFGGALAASLPLAVAAVSTVGTFLALYAIAQITDVSVYSINLTTALGLGLAIDYSLFIVNRFREEVGTGRAIDDAVVRTVETAGRTVLFSALTVAASLTALLVFPLFFLRSFAYAGTAVVVIAAAGSLVTLPALLATLGARVARSKRPGRDHSAERAFWHRLATAVMGKPIPVAAAAMTALVILGVPFLGVSWGLPTHRALPASDDARRTSERLATEFAGNQSEQFNIVLPGVDGEGARADTVAHFRSTVEAVDGVASTTLQSTPDGSWLTVIPDVALRSAAGEALVANLRALDAPFDFGVEGAAAELVDSKRAIAGALPWALAIIGLVTFALLFAVFGSVLVPLKAIVLNLLSLTATLGAMVWVFQDGHLSSILDFTATGQLDVAMPILIFCIAFGLSMDYEVFLLSRIKEEHDRTGDNAASVAVGLEKTGRIVTAAAAVLAVTFVAVATSGVSFIKMFGVGLALAVLMDATVVRGLLVPAFMRLAGEANWWAPGFLRRLHQRWGMREAGPTVDGDGLVNDLQTPMATPGRSMTATAGGDRADTLTSRATRT